MAQPTLTALMNSDETNTKSSQSCRPVHCCCADLNDNGITEGRVHLAGDELPQGMRIAQGTTGAIAPRPQHPIGCDCCCAGICATQILMGGAAMQAWMQIHHRSMLSITAACRQVVNAQDCRRTICQRSSSSQNTLFRTLGQQGPAAHPTAFNDTHCCANHKRKATSHAPICCHDLPGRQLTACSHLLDRLAPQRADALGDGRVDCMTQA